MSSNPLLCQRLLCVSSLNSGLCLTPQNTLGVGISGGKVSTQLYSPVASKSRVCVFGLGERSPS